MQFDDKPLAAFDSEIYKNFALFKFKRRDTGATREFRMYPGHPLNRRGLLLTLKGITSITFNGIVYDHPIVSYALAGATCEQLKELSDAIIMGNQKPWEVEKQFKFKRVNIDLIDLIEVMPTQSSLKTYGGKMHCPKLQDLPIEHTASISPPQREQLSLYCDNDLDTTLASYDKFESQIELRKKMSVEYGVDLRSKSDAQIAEAVIKAKVGALLGMKLQRPENVPRTFKYQPPAWMRFETPLMQEVFETIKNETFTLTPSGGVVLPEAIRKLKITIGPSTYQMGIGGLHSTESCAAHYTDDDFMIVDRDVASYYPAIIINTGLYPKHLGRHFLHVYRSIRDKRLEAKKAKNKTVAETLKIVLNGSFGKFGNYWSAIYAPDLMIQVTVGGQLALLMLIEQIALAGQCMNHDLCVVSANTDGIVIKCPRAYYVDLNQIVDRWEKTTGFETEETRYKAIFSRDVNSYIALKDEGGVKLKGAYAPPEPVASSWPTPSGQVCVDAVCAFLEWGFSIEDWIRNCDDVRKFVYVRKVNGGASWNGQYVGKTVRWYKANEGGAPMFYISKNTHGNHNKVAETDGCKPLMELPRLLPHDLDLEAYIAEAYDILMQIGHTPRPPKIRAPRVTKTKVPVKRGNKVELVELVDDMDDDIPF
jgi:hypothetical protein